MQMPSYELTEAIDLTKHAIDASNNQWIDDPESVAKFLEKMLETIKDLSTKN